LSIQKIILCSLIENWYHLPAELKYWVVDGFYSKKKFVDGLIALNLHLIGKLRSDADMRYLYTGEQKSRGAHRKYDGIEFIFRDAK
jgi:hypothetical protein